MKKMEDLAEDTSGSFAVKPMLFGKWSYDGVNCSEQSLTDYLSVKSIKSQVYVPYTAGKYQKKRF